MGFDNELSTFKEFVEGNYLRRYQMPTKKLKGGILVLVDSVFCVKLLKGADNNHPSWLIKKQVREFVICIGTIASHVRNEARRGGMQ